MRGLLVTGTDTHVGKTFVSVLILKSLRRQNRRVGAYKPVCSGASFSGPQSTPNWSDLQKLHQALDSTYPEEWICPQCFQAPLAPPIAAREEGTVVDESLLITGLQRWNSPVEGILIEGVGGWKCPISENETIESFAKAVGYPVLIVAAQKLGVINHTLLTIDSIRQSGLTVAGVILSQTTHPNQPELAANAEQICKFAEVPFLAEVSFQQHGELRWNRTSASIDWWDVMQAPSPPVKHERADKTIVH